VESAAVGLLAGRFAAAEQRGEAIAPPPATTAHGALLAHITGGHIETIDAGPSSFQPMNVNFGLFPPLRETPTFDRHSKLGRTTAKRWHQNALTRRALADLATGLPASSPATASSR
jgi:methylenetetrahydrofolate--tRNA-(uracil-5-)-methyltransferase